MRAQRGITGLETPIVVIVLVVAFSVFAFAALSMTYFSSDKRKENLNAGVSETRSTLEIRGTVIAKANAGKTAIDTISFQVASAAGGEAVDLSPGKTLVKYTDADQSVTLVIGDYTVTPLGHANSDKLLESGEMFEITLTGLVGMLTTDLAMDKPFVVEVKPTKGAALQIPRRTPVKLETYNRLG